jgi:hypothetical protein
MPAMKKADVQIGVIYCYRHQSWVGLVVVLSTTDQYGTPTQYGYPAVLAAADNDGGIDPERLDGRRRRALVRAGHRMMPCPPPPVSKSPDDGSGQGRLAVPACERVQDLMTGCASFRVSGHDGDDPGEQQHHGTGSMRETKHDHEDERWQEGNGEDWCNELDRGHRAGSPGVDSETKRRAPR